MVYDPRILQTAISAASCTRLSTSSCCITQLQTKGHVIVRSHVWVKSVVLEYWAAISRSLGATLFWLTALTDRNITFCDVFKTSDHTKSSWFYFTSWRTCFENDKLSCLFDVQVEVFNWNSVQRLGYFCKYDLRFNSTMMAPPLIFIVLLNENVFLQIYGKSHKRKEFCAPWLIPA